MMQGVMTRPEPGREGQATMRGMRVLQLLAVVGIALIWARLQVVGYVGDAHDYWAAELPASYEIGWNVRGGFVYSPAFWHATEPLRAFPWPVFYGAWTLLLLGALAWLLTPLGALTALLLFPPAMSDVASGNIHSLLAVAVVLMVRWPAVWALFPLTKVVPGLLIVWYAARREWRKAGLALGVTVGIVAVSAAMEPDLWVSWASMLADAPNAPQLTQVFYLPLPVRIVLALTITAIAGWRSWPWLLPIALLLSLPSVWFAGLAVLLAIPRLLRRDATQADREVGVAGDRPVVPDALEISGAIHDDDRRHVVVHG